MTAIDDLKKEIENLPIIETSKYPNRIDKDDVFKLIDKHLKGKMLVDEKDLLSEIEVYLIYDKTGGHEKGHCSDCKKLDKKLKALTRKGEG